MLFMDKVYLNEKGVRQTTGFWFAQHVHELSFENLKSVEIKIEIEEIDEYKIEEQIWHAEYESGENIKRYIEKHDDKLLEFKVDGENYYLKIEKV